MDDNVHIPTERRGKLVHVRLIEVYSLELDASGVVAEILIHDENDLNKRGIVTVSSEALNNAQYTQVLFNKPFLVWQEDVKWLHD